PPTSTSSKSTSSTEVTGGPGRGKRASLCPATTTVDVPCDMRHPAASLTDADATAKYCSTMGSSSGSTVTPRSAMSSTVASDPTTSPPHQEPDSVASPTILPWVRSLPYSNPISP